MVSSSGERSWPLKEMKTIQQEEKSSPAVNSAGNMYLDILKKAKNKQPTQQAATCTGTTATTKNFTVTKMSFGPMATVANSTNEVKPVTNSIFPPAPKEYSNTPETKPLFGKAPAPSAVAPKVSYLPKTSPAPPVKVVETTPVVTKEKEVPKIVEKSSENQSIGNGSPTKKPFGDWTVSDVADWLKELGLAVYANSFEENAIAGEHLPDLGKEELIELGVKPFGHRLTIERSIKKLVGSS